MPDPGADPLASARDAFAARRWPAAVERFAEAARAGDLGGHDHYRWAESAWWTGDIDQALALWRLAHDRFVAEGDLADAAMAATFVACHSFERGDEVTGSGWRRRAERLLDGLPEGPAHGYPEYFRLFALMGAGDLAGANDAIERLRALGERHDEAELVALATLGEGRLLLKRGRFEEGMAVLDEAMLAALSDRLHPVWTGGIYCHVMDACHEVADVGRANEWTQLAERWCDDLPPEALYRGICRVHRAQVLRVRGAWQEAEHEAARACADVAHLHVGTVAEGHYELGEVRRQRGDRAGAEDAYRRAHELGRDPQPGLALLRLAEGDADAAATSIAVALDLDSGDRLARARLCAAQVEVALARDDRDTARAACGELEATAAAYEGSGLEAAAIQARGALALREGAAGEAASALRAACRRWQQLEAPHTAATARVLLADAYRLLGDDDAAELELDAALVVFRRLGATADADRVAARRARPTPPGGLSEREAEVLRHVARGATNREVAARLFISERTVHRHVSNIFTKLAVGSRTAAAAYAFDHGLADPPG